MKKFKISKYLKRWWIIVAVLSLLGGMLFYKYMSGKQSYTAQLAFEYTNSNAEDGLNPDSSDIDVEEVRSSTVVSMAAQQLETARSVEDIRSCISIEEVIPEDVATIQEAAWEDGTEYEYFPVEYILSVTVSTGADDARNIAEAIMDSYFTLYGNKYLNLPSVPNGADSLKDISYDYLEYAELLLDFVDEINDYLQTANESWSDFRSSETGCSFSDLYQDYSLISSIYIPRLYALIIGNHVAKDKDLLVKKYNNRIDDDRLELANNEEFLEQLQEMMQTFTDQNRSNMDYHWSSDNSSTASDSTTESTDNKGDHYVLSQVYNFDESTSSYQDTTYDQLVKQYVSIQSSNKALNIDIEYCQYVLNAFGSTGEASTEEEKAEVQAAIDYIEDKLTALDAVLKSTAAEHSQKTAAEYLSVTSTASVNNSVNLKLYLIVAIFVFMVVGCGGVIVVGRGLELVDYVLYVDRITNLPNRAGADRKIEKLSQTAPVLPFGGVALKISNLAAINQKQGRIGGNRVMRAFADMLGSNTSDKDFVCYNGGLTYVVLLPGYDEERTRYWLNMFKATVDQFNTDNPDFAVEYVESYQIITAEVPMTIQSMFGRLMQKLGNAGQRSAN